MLIQANPDARGNVLRGEEAFRFGYRDKETVLRFHLWWNRGAHADFHFCAGYRAAAERAGQPVGEALDYLPMWRGALPLADQVCILEIVCEEQVRDKPLGSVAGAQWQLDRARAALDAQKADTAS